MHDAVIVGGGFAGLLTAVELSRRGADVVIVERSAEPGGVAATVRDGGYLFEPAAGSLLLPNPHLAPILAAAGVAVERATDAAATKLVHTSSGLVAAPASPPAALRTPLVSRRGKLRAALEPFVRRRPSTGDESLDATLRRRLGDEVGGFAATLMAHGIVAGDPARLSTAALFPILTELEQDAGSITRGMVRRMRSRPKGAPRVRPYPHVHRDGMSGVTRELARHLGDRIRLEWEAKEVCRGDGGATVRGPEELHARTVVLTVPPPVAAALLEPGRIPPAPSPRRAPVAIVGLGGPADALPLPPAFGFLSAPGSPLRALGVVFESWIAGNRAPDGHHLARAIYGGDADPDVLADDDHGLVARCVEELGRAIGAPVRPTWHRVHRVEPGIPQYGLGHHGWLAAAEAAAGDGVVLGGWGCRGIGISGLAADAVRIADLVTA